MSYVYSRDNLCLFQTTYVYSREKKAKLNISLFEDIKWAQDPSGMALRFYYAQERPPSACMFASVYVKFLTFI